MQLPIYLDNQATTRTDPRVVEAMLPYFDRDYGNAASASHVFGWRAEAAVDAARESLANAIGAANPREIVFTSGATESDNLAIQGVVRAAAGRGDHVVTVATEHPAVLDTCRALAAGGLRLTVLPVDREGLVDPEAVRRALDPRTVLVSVMAANSEIGVLQPLEAIGRICREHGVPFHSDAAQALGKIPLDVGRLQVDLLSLSAHKLHGPTGIGALYVRGRPRVPLAPLLHGGGHERGRRSGTLPVPLIVGFARAVDLCLADLPAESARIAALRDRLWSRLAEALPGTLRNGHPTTRLPGNLNVSFEGVEADALLVALTDVALSTGSACSSASGRTSHVLEALGLPPDRIRGGLRFGVGRFNTAEEIEWVAGRVIEVVRKLER
jgi:cysteine desulfurase